MDAKDRNKITVFRYAKTPRNVSLKTGRWIRFVDPCVKNRLPGNPCRTEHVSFGRKTRSYRRQGCILAGCPVFFFQHYSQFRLPPWLNFHVSSRRPPVCSVLRGNFAETVPKGTYNSFFVFRHDNNAVAKKWTMSNQEEDNFLDNDKKKFTWVHLDKVKDKYILTWKNKVNNEKDK